MHRAQILSLYMIISFMGLSLSQTLVTLSEPSKYILFALASILISISLVPLTLSQVKPPEETDVELLGFDKLFKISPLATLGSFGTGLVLGAFWGLSAAYFFKLGLPPNQVALVIGVTYIGGLIFQYPIGFISDQIDRRIAILGTLLISVIVCILITYQFKIVNELSLKVILLCFFFGGFVCSCDLTGNALSFFSGLARTTHSESEG